MRTYFWKIKKKIGKKFDGEIEISVGLIIEEYNKGI